MSKKNLLAVLMGFNPFVSDRALSSSSIIAFGIGGGAIFIVILPPHLLHFPDWPIYCSGIDKC